MPYLDVYIGDPETVNLNPTNEEYNIGNAPRRISPFSPDRSSFYELLDNVKTGKWEGQQIDWGAWVTFMTPDEMIKYLEEREYSRKKYLNGPENKSHWDHSVKALFEFIDTLDKLRILVKSSTCSDSNQPLIPS